MLSKILDYSIQSDLVCFNNLLYVPDSAQLRPSIFNSVHDSSFSGHFGQTRTFNICKERRRPKLRKYRRRGQMICGRPRRTPWKTSHALELNKIRSDFSKIQFNFFEP
jgi:hypothetical protein